MDQLHRREFLLRVLSTIGVTGLKNSTGFNEQKITEMAIGKAVISNEEINSIYTALTKGV